MCVILYIGKKGDAMQKIKDIYLRKLNTFGIKGISNTLKLDFTPTKSREHLENVEFYGLDRSRYEFGVLKTIFLIGQNGAGKSSALESIFSLYSFFKDPANWFRKYNNKIMLNFSTKENSDGVMWDSEFSFMFGKKIYLLNYFVNIKDGGVAKENLSFKTTIDGKVISETKKVFESDGTHIKKINEKNSNIAIYTGNGAKMIDTKEMREIVKKEFPDDSEAIISFVRQGMSMSIGRESTIGKTFHLTPLNTVPNKKLVKQLLSLYKLFDKNIKGINEIGGVLFVEYEIGKNIIEKLSINDFFEIISSGGARVGELATMIMTAVTMENYSIMIDEIERSLHESLSEFLTAFLIDHVDGQKFFATHNLDLFNNEVLFIRPDQISIIMNDDFMHKIKRGSDIATTAKHDFKREYIKMEFLEHPSQNIREEIWDVFLEEENK